ncbi:MAG: hypothetical protein EOO62_26985, partial [Hymenobacter sp.]
MNKLYFLFLLLSAPLVSQAQLSGADSLRQRLNTIFAHLDKSQVPTGYLEEYGVRLLPLANYAGTLTDSSLADLATLRCLRASLSIGPHLRYRHLARRARPQRPPARRPGQRQQININT